MKKAIALGLVLVMMLVAGSAMAAMKGTNDVVKVSVGKGTLTAPAGSRFDFTIKLDIAKKWHIYAHGDSNFIGVDLVADKSLPLEDLKTVYPQGHEGEFFGDKVVMIDGREVIKVSALVPAGLAKGKHELKFFVTAQACDDKSCLAPADLPVSLTLMVE
jgi:hypothetical protein